MCTYLFLAARTHSTFSSSFPVHYIGCCNVNNNNSEEKINYFVFHIPFFLSCVRLGWLSFCSDSARNQCSVRCTPTWLDSTLPNKMKSTEAGRRNGNACIHKFKFRNMFWWKKIIISYFVSFISIWLIKCSRHDCDLHVPQDTQSLFLFIFLSFSVVSFSFTFIRHIAGADLTFGNDDVTCPKRQKSISANCHRWTLSIRIFLCLHIFFCFSCSRFAPKIKISYLTNTRHHARNESNELK